MKTMVVDLLRWVGYSAGIAGFALGTFITLIAGESYGDWDYILPVALVAVPFVSLVLATRWSLVAGVALVAAGLVVGLPIATMNVWVAALYGLPVLVSGLAFILCRILLFIEESHYAGTMYDFKTSVRLLSEPPVTEAVKPELAEVPTVILEFGERAAEDEETKWENELGRWKPAIAVVNGEEKPLTSRYLKKSAYASLDTQYRAELILEWDEEGSEMARQVTQRLAGKPLAIFEGNEPVRGQDGRPIALIVGGVIADRWRIMGLHFQQAFQLSNRLNITCIQSQ